MTALERAARAVWSAGPISSIAWDDAPERAKAHAVAVARAVLMAVKEPDKGIMDEAFSDVLEPVYPGDFGRVIDAILNEKDTTND